MNASKKMMYDDLILCAGMLIFGIHEAHYWLALFGWFWLSIRLWHLTHQSEVFDEGESK